MKNVIAQLFAARDIAHRLHLKTQSFAAHLALGDLYSALIEHADQIAEAWQGKYGVLDIPNPIFTFTETSAVEFIKELAQFAENSRARFNPEDTNLINDWDAVISTVYAAKYKLERFQ